MPVSIEHPKLVQFINEQMATGLYSSVQEIVEAAVAPMIVYVALVHLTDEDVEAIEESDRQVERGEVIELDEIVAMMRKEHNEARPDAGGTHEMADRRGR